MNLVNARMLCKVDLPPASGTAKLPDALACYYADVPCHSPIVGLAFELDLVHTFSASGKVGI